MELYDDSALYDRVPFSQIVDDAYTTIQLCTADGRSKNWNRMIISAVDVVDIGFCQVIELQDNSNEIVEVIELQNKPMIN